MNTDALKRSVESGELNAEARYAFALSMRSANALRNACSAAVSLLSLLAWAVSQVDPSTMRSEEHTSELQSHSDLVCRLLLEKKKKGPTRSAHTLPDRTL